MFYNSLEEIVRECQEKDLPFDEVILLDDMNERNVSREESIETMRGMWEAMKGAERNYDGSLQSRSGLVASLSIDDVISTSISIAFNVSFTNCSTYLIVSSSTFARSSFSFTDTGSDFSSFAFAEASSFSVFSSRTASSFFAASS